MSDINITATNLRRKLKEALRTAESGEGRVLITRHGKVVAVLSAPLTPAPADEKRVITEEQVKEAFEAVKEADNVFKIVNSESGTEPAKVEATYNGKRLLTEI